MLAELSRLYNAGGASVIAALVLGSYLLYFLWCALRLWRIDVREHRLPHRILIPLAIATYTALPVSLLFAGRPADIWRVIGAGLVLWFCYLLLRILSFGALGRGDVKLAGILGGVLGYLSWANLGWASLVTFLAGGLVSLALVLFTKARGSTRIAFGPFMLLGALVALAARRILCGRFRSRVTVRLSGGLVLRAARDCSLCSLAPISRRNCRGF